jgi:hypothetical protein
VTRCEGNVIYELDGKPIQEIFRDYMADDEIKNWDLVKIAMTFSLGLEAPGYMQDHDEYVIRAIVALERDEATGSIDYITIPTEISEGTSIRVARRDYEKLANGIERVAEEITTQIGDNPARLVFQFDCTARGKAFLREQQKLRLLETLQGRIGPDVPWLGFYTYGEISPVGRHNCFHNYTVALTTVY